MLHQSIEAGCLISVIEGQPEDTRQRLRDHMLDGELIEFYEHVSALLDLVGEEVTRRNGRLYKSTPVADTGEINVIRGRE
jgi:hypothetical protein